VLATGLNANPFLALYSLEEIYDNTNRAQLQPFVTSRIRAGHRESKRTRSYFAIGN